MKVRPSVKSGAEPQLLNTVFLGLDHTTPGVAVLVATKKEILYEKYIGLANLEYNIPIRKDTLFNLASISKPLTATGIMLLVQKKRLSLDDEVGVYFPELKSCCKSVRIRHLLSHSSGVSSGSIVNPSTGDISSPENQHICNVLRAGRFFPESSNKTHFDYAEMRASYGNKDVYEMFLASSPFCNYPPGTRYEYSNTWYALLALLVERVLDRPFSEFMKESVFQPFGMDCSCICSDMRQVIPKRAWGYNRHNNGEYSFQQRVFFANGSGGVFSNVRDLYRFWKGLLSDRFLKKDLRELMWSDVVQRERKDTFYGYGWQIDHSNSLYRVGHTGSMEGFKNILRFYPQEGLLVCVLSNSAYLLSGEERESCADKIYRIFTSEKNP
ncbi:beta-lactamase family protein [bacterium]|nr:beta-lactamase family protein [bacterium]